MLVNFEKMQGLGNDFVVIDLITQNVRLESLQIQHIADRHFGIGCDQVILLEPPIRPEADFFYRIYNADGQEVEQCGNGARCAARFFYDCGFTNHRSIKADCLGGPIDFQLEDDESVSVNMGKPVFKPEQIPLALTTENDLYTIQLNSLQLAELSIPPEALETSKAPEFFFNPGTNSIHFSALAIGNPHAILQVFNIESVSVKDWGKFLSSHPLFPKETNVEFMQILNPQHIRLRVYERGVGETLACGSGATAAAVMGIKLKLLQSPVTVAFSTGELQIHWEGEGSSITMRGPAFSVFAGRFRL